MPKAKGIKIYTFKVGQLASIGILLILFSQVRGAFASPGFLIGLAVFVVGLIFILLDKKGKKLTPED